MAKNKVEILALIDRSGSMCMIMDETVGAFNEFIKEQRETAANDKVKVTLASFDNKYETLFDRVKLKDVPELTTDMVEPRGMTALNDAIGNLINSAKHPDRDTIVLIQTDGCENASKEHTKESIKKLVEQKEADGWEFVFIGAGLDERTVADMASERGIKDFLSVQASSEGMDTYKNKISASTVAYRMKT